jgi:hypothetical protein
MPRWSRSTGAGAISPLNLLSRKLHDQIVDRSELVNALSYYFSPSPRRRGAPQPRGNRTRARNARGLTMSVTVNQDSVLAFACWNSASLITP